MTKWVLTLTLLFGFSAQSSELIFQLHQTLNFPSTGTNQIPIAHGATVISDHIQREDILVARGQIVASTTEASDRCWLHIPGDRITDIDAIQNQRKANAREVWFKFGPWTVYWAPPRPQQPGGNLAEAQVWRGVAVTNKEIPEGTLFQILSIRQQVASGFWIYELYPTDNSASPILDVACTSDRKIEDVTDLEYLNSIFGSVGQFHRVE